MTKNNFRLVDAPNVENPCLLVLDSLGYEIGIYPPDDGSEGLGHWYARKDEREFIAGDPLALLGLVSLWLHRGDDWKSGEDEDLQTKIIDQTYPE